MAEKYFGMRFEIFKVRDDIELSEIKISII